jgi:hypothetical protein
MIIQAVYDELKNKYSTVASWALWSPAGATKKSNTADLSVFDVPNLHEKLNPKYVFIALNAANHPNSQILPAWSSFHSGYRYQNDYKLRTATQGTRFEGAYITDIIKHYVETDSTKVKSVIRKNPTIVTNNLIYLQEELNLLKSSNNGTNPILIALGNDVYNVLNKYITGYTIKNVKHYAGYFSDIWYKQHFANELATI